MILLNNNYYYSENKEDLKLNEIAKLYHLFGFGDEAYILSNPLFIKSLFTENVYGAFVFTQEKELVGMVRVMSDNYTLSFLCELAVLPKHQNKGIGTTLLVNMLMKFSHTVFFANVFIGQEHFFEQVGITKRKKLISFGKASEMRRIFLEKNRPI